MPVSGVNIGEDPQLSGVLCELVSGGPGSGGESTLAWYVPFALLP